MKRRPMSRRATWLFVALLASAPACSGGTAGTAAGRSARSVIRVTGSDTMVNLVQAWAERYKPVRPDVIVQVAGGGSGVGIAGLIDGTLDVAAASREMKPPERQRAALKYGVEPVELTVARDALAVYVNESNPIRAISLTELADIYGEDGSIVRWSQLGVVHPACASDRIIRIGRQNNSGTFSYFRDVVLGRAREYKMGSIDQSGSKDVVALVSRTPCAIGYSGIAFAIAGVRPIGIASRPGAAPVAPGEASVTRGSYPLARPLYLYTARKPDGHIAEFLQWVLSPSGQEIVRDLGLVPSAAGAPERATAGPER